MSKTNWNHIDFLAKKVLSGEKEYYREFLELIQDYVKIKINKMIPATGREDVTQEILLAVHKSLKTLDTKRSCKAWINAISHYKVSDYLRTLYKESNTILENEQTSITDLSQTEVRQYLSHLTSVLSKGEIEILLKLKYEGFSISEVAKEVNLSESNIKVISFRAIKKMRELITDEEFNER